VICDAFYPAMAKPERVESVGFWRFMSGEISLAQVPGELAALAGVWGRWMHCWLGCTVEEEVFRLQLHGAMWDWLGTMVHPWRPEGGVWPHIEESFGCAARRAKCLNE